MSILILVISCSCHITAQEVIFDIAKKYYRSDPFEKEFSKFLDHLMNDPTLTNKKTLKKTDSTLFFFEGSYTSHNPFLFTATHTKIILAEKEEAENDTSQYIYTTFLYQLVAYTTPGAEGIKNVQDEFDKFCRHYKKRFDGENYKELKTQEKQVGEIRDYTLGYAGFSPLTVAWAISKESNNNLFALTIRFRVFDNQAYLPIITNGF